MKSTAQDRWIKIISNHCRVYGPSLQAINKAYNLNIQLIKDKDGPGYKEINNYYLCPLCLKQFVFIEDNEIQCSEEFDMDHYPPQSAGGKKTLLVCKKCNNTYGAKFDHAIKNYLSFQAFLNKKTVKLKAFFAFNNVKGRYSSSLGWEGNKLVNILDFKQYPLLTDELKKAVNSTEELKFSFKFLIPDETIIHKSFLKIAYLACFERFGYEFAYSNIGSNIIAVLNDKKLHPLSNLGVFKDETVKTLPEGLYLIEDPKEFQCFMYICNSTLNKVEEQSNTFVLIPKYKNNSWEEFKHFEALIPKGELSFSLFKITTCPVKDGEYFGYYKTSQL